MTTSTMRNRLHVVPFSVVVGLAALAVTLLSVTVATTTSSVTPAIVTRSVLVTALLLVTSRAFVARAGDGGRPVARALLAGLLLAYVIDVASWVGRAYASQLVLDPGPVTALCDLVLWLAVGATALLGRNGRP